MSTAESAERGKVDPAVELVVKALDRDPRLRGIEGVVERYRWTLATVATEALAGRLLPPVVQTREERAHSERVVNRRGIRQDCPSRGWLYCAHQEATAVAAAREGWAQAIQVVRDHLDKAQSDPAGMHLRDLMHASRMGRITALGQLLAELEQRTSQGVSDD